MRIIPQCRRSSPATTSSSPGSSAPRRSSGASWALESRSHIAGISPVMTNVSSPVSRTVVWAVLRRRRSRAWPAARLPVAVRTRSPTSRSSSGFRSSPRGSGVPGAWGSVGESMVPRLWLTAVRGCRGLAPWGGADPAYFTGLVRGGPSLCGVCRCLLLGAAPPILLGLSTESSRNESRGVEDECGLAADVDECRQHWGEQPEGGEDHTDEIDGDGPAEVEHHDTAGTARHVHGAHEVVEVGTDENNVGTLAGYVGSGAHGDADLGAGEGRSVVDAV